MALFPKVLSHTRQFLFVFYLCDVIGCSGYNFSSRTYLLLTTFLTFYQINNVLAYTIDVLSNFILLLSSLTLKLVVSSITSQLHIFSSSHFCHMIHILPPCSATLSIYLAPNISLTLPYSGPPMVAPSIWMKCLPAIYPLLHDMVIVRASHMH